MAARHRPSAAARSSGNFATCAQFRQWAQTMSGTVNSLAHQEGAVRRSARQRSRLRGEFPLQAVLHAGSRSSSGRMKLWRAAVQSSASNSSSRKLCQRILPRAPTVPAGKVSVPWRSARKVRIAVRIGQRRAVHVSSTGTLPEGLWRSRRPSAAAPGRGDRAGQAPPASTAPERRATVPLPMTVYMIPICLAQRSTAGSARVPSAPSAARSARPSAAAGRCPAAAPARFPAAPRPSACACRSIRSRRGPKTGGRSRAMPCAGAAGMRGGGVQRAEMPGRADARATPALHPLRLQPPHQRRRSRRCAPRPPRSAIVQRRLGRAGRHRGDIVAAPAASGSPSL